MSAQDLKISIQHLLETTDDPEILALIYALLKKFSIFDSEEVVGYDMDGTPITDEDFVQSILTSSKATKSGEVISHTEMKTMLGLHV